MLWLYESDVLGNYTKSVGWNVTIDRCVRRSGRPWLKFPLQIRLDILFLAVNVLTAVACEVSSSHGGEYEVQICLLGFTAV
jgi:hypothetical protein